MWTVGGTWATGAPGLLGGGSGGPGVDDVPQDVRGERVTVGVGLEGLGRGDQGCSASSMALRRVALRSWASCASRAWAAVWLAHRLRRSASLSVLWPV